MNKLISILVGALLALALIVGLIGIFKEETPSLGMSGFNDLGYSGVTNDSVEISITTLATSSNTVLSANSARLYARIEPYDQTIFVHLTSDTSSLAVTEGIQLDPGEVYEIGPNNLYIGAVVAIASGSTSTVLRVEK